MKNMIQGHQKMIRKQVRVHSLSQLWPIYQSGLRLL